MRLHLGPKTLGTAPAAGQLLELPPGPARHLQVLRAQPGDRVECFEGDGRAWWAEVLAIQRQGVTVRLQAEVDEPSPELSRPVCLAVAMPANDRMDFLVEKATELGMAALQPLVSERSVLRLSGERAERKVAHWSAVAAGAAEQSGRRVVPQVHPVSTLPAFLQRARSDASALRLLLHPQAAAPAAASPPFRTDAQAEDAAESVPPIWLLSGPEGGLSPTEAALAREAGFLPVSLGRRVLRADTAPLTWLAHFAQIDAARGLEI